MFEELISLFTVLLAGWDLTFLLPLSKTEPGKQTPHHSTMESTPCQVHSCKSPLQRDGGDRGAALCECEEGIFQWKKQS